MPTYRTTNSGLQTKGTLWAGFDPTVSAIVAGVFMLTVMASFAIITAFKLSWLVVLPFCFVLPNLLMLAIVFYLIMGKPPRYLADWVDARLLARTDVLSGKVTEPERFDLS